ncbi:MAG: type IX secretion system membrane protein PorP/SprF [Saprospiraceae bacterium]|nr:type IX secretion system membrane protein PorP/SprF [Saprospiraceae bacterium]
MMRLLNIIIYVLFLLGSISGQTGRDWPDHPDLQHLSNPALLNKFSNLSVALYHSRRFRELQSSPSLASLAIAMPMKRTNTALGLHLLSDKIGPLVRNGMELTYAYHFSVGMTGRDQVAMGLAVKVNQLKFDANHLILDDQNDILLSDLTPGRIMPPALNVGFQYFTGQPTYASPVQIHSGLAVGRFLPFEDKFNSFSIERNWEWNTNFGVDVYLAEEAILTTDFLCRKVSLLPTNYILRSSLSYRSIGWLMLQFSRAGYFGTQVGFNMGGGNADEISRIKIFLGGNWNVQKTKTTLGSGFSFGVTYTP